MGLDGTEEVMFARGSGAADSGRELHCSKSFIYTHSFTLISEVPFTVALTIHHHPRTKKPRNLPTARVTAQVKAEHTCHSCSA